MNTKAIAALGVLIALIAVAFVLNRETNEGESRLELPGFVEVEANAVKSVTELNIDAFDKVELERKGEKMVFAKVDGTWKMTQPREAAIEETKLKSIFLPHQRKLVSTFSTRFLADTADDYGLDSANAIKVGIYKAGAVFAAYEVGESAKSEDPEARADEVDTWVRSPGGDTIYRMAGVDLRTAVNRAASDFRDKKLFDFEREQIARIEIHNPEASEGTIVIVNDSPAPTAKDNGVQDDGAPKDDAAEPEAKAAEVWTLAKPEGFRSGTGVTTFLSSLTGLRATEFMASTEGVDTGLSGETKVRLRIEMRDGAARELWIGKSQGNDTYAQFAGNEEVIRLTKYSAESVVKRLADLRDKKVVDIPKETITAFRFPAGDIVRQAPDQWTVVRPEGVRTSKSVAESLLRDVEMFSITEFLPAGDLAEVGLGPSDPTESITIEHSGGSFQLIFSAEKDGYYHARSPQDSRGEVWKVTSFMAKKFAAKSVDDLRRREVFEFKKDDIVKVELHHPGEIVVLERLNTEAGGGWSATAGERRNNAAKEMVVTTLVSTLSSLSAKGFAHGKAVQDVGLGNTDGFRIVATLASGSRHELRLSETKEDDAPYAAAPTEPDWQGQVFTINPFQAGNLEKRFADFE